MNSTVMFLTSAPGDTGFRKLNILGLEDTDLNSSALQSRMEALLPRSYCLLSLVHLKMIGWYIILSKPAELRHHICASSGIRLIRNQAARTVNIPWIALVGGIRRSLGLCRWSERGWVA